MKNYLAIDIGASSGRHIVGWIDEEGKIRTEEVYRFKNGAIKTKDGLVWDTEGLFKSIVLGIKAAFARYKEIASIGIDTWGCDYVLMNGDEEILPCYSYRDARNIKAADSVHRQISHSELYKRTGIAYEPFNTIYQLYSDKKSGRLDLATDFLMLPEYFSYRLTGVKKKEYTDCTTTGLINATTHTWDNEIIEALGYDRAMFGELAQPGTVVGELREEIAKEVGGKSKVVLCASHDTASAVLAAPIEGAAPYISSGTWSLLGIEQSFAHTDENSRKVNYSNEGSINYGFRYQKNIMGLWIIQSIRREFGEEYSFSDLAKMAKVKPAGKVIDVNDERFLSPMRMTSEIKKAVGENIGMSTLMRIVYDSLALSYKMAIDELEKNTGKTYDTLNIIGGGSRDEFLNELTAKATGKRIITGPVEATATGNIIMQMIGAGELADLASARKIIKESFEIKEVTA